MKYLPPPPPPEDQRPQVDKLIILDWFDIVTSNGWGKPREPMDPATCRTVGFVQHVSDTCLTIASTLGMDKIGGRETNSRIVIPWGCITSWRYMMGVPTNDT